MGLFDHFPYTNVHELNLDWLLTMMKALDAEWDAFTAGNSLTFADPLQHDMSKTYAKNTIVIDGSGNAYVSLQAVPVGVGLGNQDYWLMVFDYEAFIEKVNKNFTAIYYRGTYRASAALAIGDWLTVDDVLYKATAAIAVDDLLEVGVNIEHFTLEDFIKAFMQSANQLIQQYKNDIDASELAYRQQLANDIAATTASLQAQLDAAISGVTVDSEVINARVGWNSDTHYATLGDALRTQITDLVTALNGEYTAPTFITDTYINANTGAAATLSAYVATNFIEIKNTKCIGLKTYVGNDVAGYAFYDDDQIYITGANSYANNGVLKLLNVPDNAKYIRITCWPAYTDAFILFQIPSMDAIDEINDMLKFSFMDFPYTITDGAYVNKNDGTQQTLAAYCVTDLADFGIADCLIIRTHCGNDVSGICFYNSTGQFISGYNPYSDNDKFIQVNIPVGATSIRVSCQKASISKLAIYGVCTVKTISTIISRHIDEVVTKEAGAIVNKEYVDYSNGNLISYNNAWFNRTDPIEVKPNDFIRVYTALVASAGIAFYDKDNNFIKGINTTLANYGTYYDLVAPPNAAYIVASIMTRYMSLEMFSIDIFRTEAMYEVINNDWFAACDRILCIGDSLTAGACYTDGLNGAEIQENIPNYMHLLSGLTITNAGYGGASASDWYTQKRSYYDFADYDTFFIWLGTNGGLTDTLDTDVDPFVDYNDFLPTNTGYYCRLIRDIRDHNSSCKIFLININAPYSTYQDTNAVIEKIAAKYGLFILDTSDLAYQDAPQYHGNLSNPHYSKSGNLFLAQRFMHSVSNFFSYNPTRADYAVKQV